MSKREVPVRLVEFYFDLVSPYSYLAHARIGRLCEAADADLALRPMLLGAVLKETGGRAATEIPAKRRYMLRDLGLLAESSGTPKGMEEADEDGPITEVARRIGVDPVEVLDGAAQAKEALRAATAEALERGVFGAPTFFVGDEMFWGNDRIPFVEAALGRG